VERPGSGHEVVGAARLLVAVVPDGLPPGGTTLVCMRSEQGWELYNTWTYRSIEPMNRIEFVHGFADENGTPVTPAELGLPPGIPDEVRHEVRLSAIDDHTTELTVHEFGYPNAEIVEVSRVGLEQCLDKMAAAALVD
jgi:uncharacterized protein YndB with AHSA1/START domain